MAGNSLLKNIEKIQLLLSQNGINPSSKKELETELHSLKNGLQTLDKLKHEFNLNPGFTAFHDFINENTQQAYYCISNNKTFIWQGATQKVLGWPLEKLTKFTFNDYIALIHKGDKDAFISFHKKDHKENDTYKLKYRVLNESGEYFFLEDTGKYTRNSKGDTVKMGILSFFNEKPFLSDISTQKERNYNIIHEVSLLNTHEISLEDMLKQCLGVISKYTHWPVGRAIILYKGRFESLPYHSIWFNHDTEKFNKFSINSNDNQPISFSPLHLELIESRKHFLFKDLDSVQNTEITDNAKKMGLKNVILFTIPLKSQPAVILEFYSNVNEKPDLLLLGLLKQLSIVIGNILERKITEDEFERFLLAIEQNFASVVITNSNGEIIYTNPRFSEMTGYSREDLLGKKPGIVKSGLHDKAFYKEMWKTISSGNKWQGEIINRRKDGILYWEQVNISPIKDKDGVITHYVGVKIDITEKKKSEEELKKAKDLAEFANKTKSEFLASMSHEIRTPMNAILGFAELLSLKITDELQSSYLESIRSSGKTLLNLINDVLDLSKIEAGKMKVSTEFFDPFHLFKDVEYMFALKAQEKGLEFKVEVDMNLPVSIESDEIRLRQILINLIGNAVKFTEKGYVTVAVKCNHSHYKGDDQYIEMQIDVADSGIGISEEFREIMFSPFTQQEGQDNKRYGGTGLGLTITRKLVHLLNATLTVESKPGMGSIFTIHFEELRASTKMQRSSGLSTITPDKIKFEPAVIIVADDVENNRNYFKGVVEKTGIEIIESDNGLTTIELAKTHKPAAIITDIKMPGIDGFELLKRIREIPELKNIPVVATTASTSVEDKNKLFKHNFDGILIKPIQVNDVYLELMRLLPHNIIETENQLTEVEGVKNESNGISISAISDEHIQTVRRMLETDLFSVWKTFDEQQPLSEVELFARNCRELGQKYELGILISYGNRLLSAINNFDIDNMLKTIQEYPKLVRTFKTINEE